MLEQLHSPTLPNLETVQFLQVKVLCHASKKKTAYWCAMPCVHSLHWFLDKFASEYEKEIHMQPFLQQQQQHLISV